MLEEVRQQVAKNAVRETLLELGLLKMINLWLRPLADGALPRLELRQTLFRILDMLAIDDSYLQHSSIADYGIDDQGQEFRDESTKMPLGWVINQNAHNKEETRELRGFLKNLIQKWGRKIHNLKTDYTHLREVEMERKAHILRRRKAMVERPITPYMANPTGMRYPVRDNMDFVYRPNQTIHDSERTRRERDPDSVGSQLHRAMRNFSKSKNDTTRAMSVSIKGKGLIPGF